MSNVVIIGAGQSGRGYINRLFYLSKERVIFLDKDETLIQKLQSEKAYTIAFGNQERETLLLQNFDAFLTNTTQAHDALCNADIVFISIGANHLIEVEAMLIEAIKKRGKKTLDVITAENGVNPAAQLSSLAIYDGVHLSESIIFCTTIEKTGSLDILSENLDHLPYDVIALGHNLPYVGMVAELQFKNLLERKIYTYNCLSACIAYLGYVKGYEHYAEAANDEQITKRIHEIAIQIDNSIAKEYCMDVAIQKDFSKMAINKFQNRNIVDSVERNVRDVERKLGRKERIIAPLCILEKHNEESLDLLYVAACALYYGVKTKTIVCDKIDERISRIFDSLPPKWITIINENLQHLLSTN